MHRRRAGRLVLIGLAAAIAAGCTLPPGALDGPLGVILHIDATPTSIDVAAENWYAPTTEIYVCPSEPPPLPEPGPDLVGWTPGPPCHSFGRRPSEDGLFVSLPIADLGGNGWPAFAAADPWYLLLLDMDGERVSSAVKSAFQAPDSTAAP